MKNTFTRIHLQCAGDACLFAALMPLSYPTKLEADRFET